MYITDAVDCDLTLIQFYAIEVLAKMYPDHLAFDKAFADRFNMFDKVCGTAWRLKNMSYPEKCFQKIIAWLTSSNCGTKMPTHSACNQANTIYIDKSIIELVYGG